MYLTNQLKLWSSFLLSKKNAAMSIFGSTLLWIHAIVWVCVSHKCPKLCLLDRRVCAPLVFVDATQSSPIEVVWVGHASDVFPQSPAALPVTAALFIENQYLINYFTLRFSHHAWDRDCAKSTCISFLGEPAEYFSSASSVLFWLIYRNSFHMKGRTVWLWSNK